MFLGAVELVIFDYIYHIAYHITRGNPNETYRIQYPIV